MLEREEAKAGTTISQFAQRHDPWEVKQEVVEHITPQETQVALAVATKKLSAARQAVGMMPLPSAPPPKAAAAAGGAATFVPHPAYMAPCAAWVMPREEVQKHYEQDASTLRASPEPGWAMVSSPAIDLQSKIILLQIALASMAEGHAPHSTTAGYSPATVGPPGWAG